MGSGERVYLRPQVHKEGNKLQLPDEGNSPAAKRPSERREPAGTQAPKAPRVYTNVNFLLQKFDFLVEISIEILGCWACMLTQCVQSSRLQRVNIAAKLAVILSAPNFNDWIGYQLLYRLSHSCKDRDDLDVEHRIF